MLRGNGPFTVAQDDPRRAEIETHRPLHYAMGEGTGNNSTVVRHDEPPLTFNLTGQAALSKPPSISSTSYAYDGSGYPPISTQQQQHHHHQRQQSAPVLSLLNPSSRSQSPLRAAHARHQSSQDMPLTGDGRVSRCFPENSPGRFNGWLGGTNTPSSADGAISPSMTPKPRRAATSADSLTPKSATSSRFGFITSSVSAFTTRLTANQTQATNTAQLDDEICSMDIESFLFPAHALSDRDAFSPAAFKNLQTNASGLLHKMQVAYRQRTTTLRETQAEREAQMEEMEETEMRTRNFRSQLEKMAAKAAEQDKAMQQLMAELQAEKKARLEVERIGREKLALRNVDLGYDAHHHDKDLEMEGEEEGGERKSDGTARSDLSIDTDIDSVFSRSRSPTQTMTSVTTESEHVVVDSMVLLPGCFPLPSPSFSPDHYQYHSSSFSFSSSSIANTKRAKKTPPPPLNLSKPEPKPKPARLQQQTPQQQLTTFQRLVKGISGETDEDRYRGAGCENCRGKDSSAAWDTVSLLRDENKSLKQRVAHLEVVVDGALDVVNGIRAS